jgi:cysteinyl-tRNA synthetase
MALHVFNTLTRKKDEFIPARPPVVRIYTCGLTVYSPMHIGHARTYCFWDVFRRFLEYRGFYVMSVINYTDIDDRNIEAADETRGAMDIAEGVAATFRRDCRALRIKDYAAYTRATDFVQGQIEMVAKLLELGHAYIVNGEVFYDVSSFPGYGKLSGRSVSEQQTGASGRVTEDVGRKRHPADFTLWKPSPPGHPSWQTGQAGWESGRPGWHIECSVMSSATLGESFDVHGGAVDNLFPHHENEIAQSEPLCGCKPWVRYWMHPEHLDLRGEKMSKSLGNIVGIPDMLSRHNYDDVRWFYAMTHYRSKLSFSDDLIDSAAEGFSKIKRLVRILEDKLSAVPDEQLKVPAAGDYASLREGDDAVPRFRHRYTYSSFGEITAKMMGKFLAALDDDLNCPLATAALFDYVNELYAAGIEQYSDVADVLAAYQALTRHLYVLGIEYPSERLFPELAAECLAVGGGGDTEVLLEGVVHNLAEFRENLRANKEYEKADFLRKVLDSAGLLIEDTQDKPRWEVIPEIALSSMGAWGYYGHTKELEIEYRHGKRDVYIDVPEDAYQKFKESGFSAAFYIRNIRGKYKRK